ncbi:hypothetical protein S40288_10656 [Stachybotrys chartarum IBT 40288]|nr:hypothetical protein S40288_10656 [Stachybotrys chartarum IBT 40288]
MGSYTLQLVDCAPIQSGGPGEDVGGWHVAVQGHDQGDDVAGSQISILYPFDISIEKNIRWYLESFPTKTPWELRKASKVQKQISDYAVGIFRQLHILHSIGASPDIDTINIDVSERGSGAALSNIFRLHWEVLESPKVWDELWAIAFPPKLLRKRKPVPKVTVRRVIPQHEHFDSDNGFDWSDEDLSDGSGRMVTGSFKRSYQSDGRRSIVQDQKVDYTVVGTEPLISQHIHIKLSFFRVLLVVARRIDTEKDTQPQANDSTEENEIPPDLDSSLVSEPLLEAISQLSESLDVRLEVCRPGSWDALQSLLAEKGHGYYDLVHFDLHGAVLRSKGAGLYFLSPETNPKRKEFGKTVFEPAHKIGKLLREAGVLMVALNACETAREDPIDDETLSKEEHPPNTAGDVRTEKFSSALGVQVNLAKTFVQCGVPSVLAMSHRITAGFVAVFYNSFYNALLKSQSDVREAVSIARQSLMSQNRRVVGFGLDVELADWIIPVLYQSHIVTFDIVSTGELDSTRPRVAEDQHLDMVPARKKFFRRVFNRDSSSPSEVPPRRSMAIVSQSTNRLIDRGLDILFVEALLLARNSRQTLFISGKYGIGKTHFVKGLGNLWALTGWKVTNVLDAIIRKVNELDPTASTIEQVQMSLRQSQTLIIVDNVEPENLASEADAADAQHSLQSFIQSLDGGKSMLIIVSREDLSERSRLFSRQIKNCVRFWELTERDELAVQEVTLDMLRGMRQSRKLTSKYETRDMRRFLKCLDYNPQLIALFLKTMSRAGQSPSMEEALHNVLFSVVKLPPDDPESRLVRVAQATFTDLGKLQNGGELQKLLLLLSQFSNFIPCGLHDEIFFPSAQCYLGYLRVFQVLEWPASADASIVQPGVDLSKDPSEMYRQLSELAKESIDPFCVLVARLIRSGLVEFTIQSLKNEESLDAINDYKRGPFGINRTRKLLMKLNYLRINPILTQYLRSQFSRGTSGPSHGFSQTSLLMAYCAYYRSFSISSWDEYASHRPNESPPVETTTPAADGAFTTDSVFFHDASNIYSSVHIALTLPHPTMRWRLLPVDVLNDLITIAMRTFNPHTPYRPLPTGVFTEETILGLLRAVISYYDAAPRAERESPTPLRTTAILSQGECWLMSFVGASEYSDIEVYRRGIRSCINGAVARMQKLRIKYGPPGEPPSSSETALGYLLEDILTRRTDNGNIRRLVGEERWEEHLDDVVENNLLATAIRGGLLG